MLCYAWGGYVLPCWPIGAIKLMMAVLGICVMLVFHESNPIHHPTTPSDIAAFGGTENQKESHSPFESSKVAVKVFLRDMLASKSQDLNLDCTAFIRFSYGEGTASSKLANSCFLYEIINVF